MIARGGSQLDETDANLPSMLPGVSDESWTEFVRRMAISRTDHVSESNALGMFEMMPRRLADLGLVEKLGRSKKNKRTIWVAKFVSKLSSDKFLRSPQLQYDVFVRSIRDYARRIDDGEITKPTEMTMSGALAILHRCGPHGLKTWSENEQFPSTKSLYERAAGVF